MSESVPHLVVANAEARQEPSPPVDFERIGSVVHAGGGPSFGSVDALLAPDSDVKPGELVAVWHGRRDRNLLTISQVVDCSEENPGETASLARTRDALALGPLLTREGSSTRIFRVAKCKTMEEVELVGGELAKETRAPEALCRAGDPVLRLPPHLATMALGCLPDPVDGLHVGRLLGTTAPIVLSAEVLQMHLLLCGSPGKGKSYAAGVFIEEMAAFDVPAILLDVNGEMVETVAALGGEVISLPDPARFGLALEQITGLELASITPQVDLGRQYAELIESAHDALRARRSQDELAGRPAAPITLDDVVAMVTQFGQSSRSAKSTSEIAIARVGRLKSNPLIGANFPFIDELTAKRMICLDCRRLQLNETRLVAAAAARAIQQHGRACARRVEAGKPRKGDADWFSVLYIDEAHNIVPEGQTTVTSNVLRELARMGRHSRTGLILASQSPADLDASILKRMQTRLIFALERDQLRSIGGVRADLGDELTDALPKLGRGVCAVSGNGDQVRHGFLMEVRRRTTPVGGGTPPVFTGRAKRMGPRP